MTDRRRARKLLAALAAPILLALVWASPADAARPSRNPTYVALGDSYASGNGTGNPDLAGVFGCYRSSDAYAPRVAAQLGYDLTFRACSGAETADVIDQARALSRKTDFVSVSVGGNDVGFVDLILSCWSALDQPLCLSTVKTVNNRIDSQLPAKLDAAYAEIDARSPRATVAVVGYPRAFGSDLSCSQADGISGTEATALNGVSDHLNTVIAQRAAAAGFTFIDPTSAFIGHDVCASTPYLNGKYAWLIQDIYHPTKAGHRDGFSPLVAAALS